MKRKTSLGEMGKDLEAAGGRINYETGSIEAIDSRQFSTRTSIGKHPRALAARRTKDAV